MDYNLLTFAQYMDKLKVKILNKIHFFRNPVLIFRFMQPHSNVTCLKKEQGSNISFGGLWSQHPLNTLS